MRIEWSPLAIEDRDRIFDYYDIDQDNPRAAVMVDERIAQQIEVLAFTRSWGVPVVSTTRES